MFKFFTNYKKVFCVTIIFLISGGLLGKVFSENAEPSMITYGFVAFAILPITFCTFGLKELGAVFPGVVDALDKQQRVKLRKIINEHCNAVIFLAFFNVFIQLLFAFLLNIHEVNKWIVTGVLFGGIVSVLIYGIFICASIREVNNFVDDVREKELSLKKSEDFKKRLNLDQL